MRTIPLTTQFKRDAKKYYIEFLTPIWIDILQKLLTDEPLPEKAKDHPLTGELKEFRDCHIKPDLALIYRKIEQDLELVRLGSHSDLFK